VQVRLEFLRMLGDWMLHLRERLDHEPRLLPYLLSALGDESPAVQVRGMMPSMATAPTLDCTPAAPTLLPPPSIAAAAACASSCALLLPPPWLAAVAPPCPGLTLRRALQRWQDAAWQLLDDLGAQYEKEHEKDLADALR
jgi:hypothetical protein